MFDVSPIPNPVKQSSGMESTDQFSRVVDVLHHPEAVKRINEEQIKNEDLPDSLRHQRDPKEKLDDEETKQSLMQRMGVMEQAARSQGHKLNFELHADSNKMVVQVMDAEGEVIRQIPPEEFLELFGRLEEMRGTLLDTVA